MRWCLKPHLLLPSIVIPGLFFTAWNFSYVDSSKYRPSQLEHANNSSINRETSSGGLVNSTIMVNVPSPISSPLLHVFPRIETIKSHKKDRSTPKYHQNREIHSIPEISEFRKRPWAKSSYKNETYTEELFNLGKMMEHVSLFSPLCIDRINENVIIFSDKYRCNSVKKKTTWLQRQCDTSRTRIHKEYNLEIREYLNLSNFKDENKKSITWVNGLTLLQALDISCGNIAHFAGRILLFEHVQNNFQIYATRFKKISNIIISPNVFVMKRFTQPEWQRSWQRGMLKALLSPLKYKIGGLDTFLRHKERSSKVTQIVHNFSISSDNGTQNRYICFRDTLVPGFMKGRFFANHDEYPSVHELSHEFDVHVPRDSLLLRNKLNFYLGKSRKVGKGKKRIVFIDRAGRSRLLLPNTKIRLLDALKAIASEAGYEFRVLVFEEMSFETQLRIMRSVTISIGVHGANLVNTIFMPPHSVLIELHPYGFKHDMYNKGGNSGLKYFSYQLKNTQHNFIGLKQFKSLQECVQRNPECKVHYRDNSIEADDGDISAIGLILGQAIKWRRELQGY